MSDELSAQLSPAQTDPRDELLLDLEWVLGTKGGRHVLMWLLEQTGLYSALWAPGSDGLTEVNIGRRDLGLRLLAKMEEVSPTAYPQLLLDRARDLAATKKENVIVLDDNDSDDDAAP